MYIWSVSDINYTFVKTLSEEVLYAPSEMGNQHYLLFVRHVT